MIFLFLIACSSENEQIEDSTTIKTYSFNLEYQKNDFILTRAEYLGELIGLPDESLIDKSWDKMALMKHDHVQTHFDEDGSVDENNEIDDGDIVIGFDQEEELVTTIWHVGTSDEEILLGNCEIYNSANELNIEKRYDKLGSFEVDCLSDNYHGDDIISNNSYLTITW